MQQQTLCAEGITRQPPLAYSTADKETIGCLVWLRNIKNRGLSLNERDILKAKTLTNKLGRRNSDSRMIWAIIMTHCFNINLSTKRIIVPFNLDTSLLAVMLEDKKVCNRFKENNRTNIDWIIQNCIRLNPENGNIIKQLLKGD